MKRQKYKIFKILILFLLFGLMSCATSINTPENAKLKKYRKMKRKKFVKIPKPEIDIFKNYIGKGTSKIKGSISYMFFGQVPCNYLDTYLKPDTEYVRAICHNLGNAYDNENPRDPDILNKVTKKVKSDKNGNYLFENVKSGKWLIFTVLSYQQSPMNEAFFDFVYWIIPVEVNDDQEISIDLNEDNVTHSWFNYGGYRLLK